MKKAYSYVRFSTPEQKLGDSKRRQEDPMEKIAEKLGLPLDYTLHLSDEGLSGWTGDNLTRGALGEFIKLVEKGEIEAGSFLIMENLDRLTRLRLIEAQNLLTGILLKGIGIYTFMDDQRYTEDNYTAALSILSTISFAEGNKSSTDKSDRLKKTWKNKRETISPNLKLTSKRPNWLDREGYQLNAKRFITTGYKPIPERVEAIKFMFKRKKEGATYGMIMKELNNSNLWKPIGTRLKKYQDLGRNPHWGKSTVEKYLRNNRAVIGEYQPYHTEKIKVNNKIVKRRVLDGDPIPDYFPSILDKQLYYQVQATFSEKGKGAGRNDKMNTLFTDMAVCSICGNPMHYKNHGTGPKGGQHLECSNPGGCPNKIRYDIIEKTVLERCVELNVNDLIARDTDDISDIELMRDRAREIPEEISAIEKKVEQLVKQLENPLIPDFTKKVLINTNERHGKEIAELNEELEPILFEIAKIEQAPEEIEIQLKDVQELFQIMSELEGDELISLRLSLRAQLRRLIKKIEINSDDKSIVIQFHSRFRRVIYLKGRIGKETVRGNTKVFNFPPSNNPDNQIDSNI